MINDPATEISYIYALVDPRDVGVVRYVGKSDAPWNRIKGHIIESRRRDGWKNNWIKSLSNDGVIPSMIILSIVERSESVRREKELIATHKTCKLTNGNDGGFGGGTTPDWVRQKMSASRRRVAASPEYFTKYSAGMKRRWQDPQFRLKCSVSHIGKKRSKESLEKLSKSLTGRKNSKETIEKRRFSVVKSHGVAVVNIETGEWFDSFSAAARSVNSAMANVRRSVNLGYAANGFHFRRADNATEDKAA